MLDFNQFLHGMAAVQRDEKAAQWIDVFRPNRWELLSLIIDTPVSEAEEVWSLKALKEYAALATAPPEGWRIFVSADNPVMWKAVLERGEPTEEWLRQPRKVLAGGRYALRGVHSDAVVERVGFRALM